MRNLDSRKVTTLYRFFVAPLMIDRLERNLIFVANLIHQVRLSFDPIIFTQQNIWVLRVFRVGDFFVLPSDLLRLVGVASIRQLLLTLGETLKKTF